MLIIHIVIQTSFAPNLGFKERKIWSTPGNPSSESSFLSSFDSIRLRSHLKSIVASRSWVKLGPPLNPCYRPHLILGFRSFVTWVRSDTGVNASPNRTQVNRLKLNTSDPAETFCKTLIIARSFRQALLGKQPAFRVLRSITAPQKPVVKRKARVRLLVKTSPCQPSCDQAIASGKWGFSPEGCCGSSCNIPRYNNRSKEGWLF